MPSEEIRIIWEEIKELNRLRESNFAAVISTESLKRMKRTEELEKKYENIEILFGHESTLSKAIIYYLDKKQ